MANIDPDIERGMERLNLLLKVLHSIDVQMGVMANTINATAVNVTFIEERLARIEAIIAHDYEPVEPPKLTHEERAKPEPQFKKIEMFDEQTGLPFVASDVVLTEEEYMTAMARTKLVKFREYT